MKHLEMDDPNLLIKGNFFSLDLLLKFFYFLFFIFILVNNAWIKIKKK